MQATLASPLYSLQIRSKYTFMPSVNNAGSKEGDDKVYERLYADAQRHQQELKKAQEEQAKLAGGAKAKPVNTSTH